MATNEPNKPDNVINIDMAKTQAEEKTAPDQPLQAGGDAPAPEMTVEEAPKAEKTAKAPKAAARKKDVSAKEETPVPKKLPEPRKAPLR